MPTSSRKPTEPPRYVKWYRGMNLYRNISPFNRAWKSTNPGRDDVGIVPYERPMRASHLTGH